MSNDYSRNWCCWHVRELTARITIQFVREKKRKFFFLLFGHGVMWGVVDINYANNPSPP
jgi:hypothetical protein